MKGPDMRRYRYLLSLLVLFAAASILIVILVGRRPAEGSEWEYLSSEAATLWNKGQASRSRVDRERAIGMATKALRSAEQEFGSDHVLVASCLNMLAMMYE